MKSNILLKDSWWIKKYDVEPKKDPLTAEQALALQNERNTKENHWISAQMPGQVQEILLKKDMIDKTVETGLGESCKWVAEQDWIYKCIFRKPEVKNKAFLHFAGLDTVVDIYLNGKHISYHNDMYLPLKLDVTDLLEEENCLLLVFHSPYKIVDELEKTMPENWKGKVRRFHLIRKTLSDYGDYLGAKPYFTPIGVFGDVCLETTDTAQIQEADMEAVLEDNYKKGFIRVNVCGTGEGQVRIESCLEGPDGNIAVKSYSTVSGRDGSSWKESLVLEVEEPELWWPANYGGQPLYKCTVAIYANGIKRDEVKKTLGFRDVKMVGDFKFEINGRPIKLWGANIAPFQGLSHRFAKDRALAVLDMVKNAHMNMLRIWGEGVPYGEELYEETDRMGILLWQEFFTGFGQLPEGEEFRRLCREEAVFLIKRLKHHPSILFWGGGNENVLFSELDYDGKSRLGFSIFEVDYKEICKQLDPGRYYHINSPWGGCYANDPLGGDTHGYAFSWYVPGIDYPVFYSESMRTSPPGLKSLRRFIKEEDLWPAGYVDKLGYGERAPMPPAWMARASALMDYKIASIEKFYDADDPEALIYKLGAAHGLYMRETIEKCRRGRPFHDQTGERRSNGHLVWKMNDTWPMIYCGIVDYYLEGYIPYYCVKRAYQPVLLSFDMQDHIYLWGVNDTADDVQGTVRLVLFNPLKNVIVAEFSFPAAIRAGESKILTNLDKLGQIRRELILYACFMSLDGDIVARTNDFLDIERHMVFPDAVIRMESKDGVLEIRSDKFARCVEISGNDDGDEFGWLFEDNYFDLLPFETKRIKVLGRHAKGVITAKAHYSKKEGAGSANYDSTQY